MKILAVIKPVPDLAGAVQPLADKSWIEENLVEFVMNPFDEIAIEAAIRFRDQHPGTTAHILCLGPPKARPIARKALAMGVEQATFLELPFYADAFLTAAAVEAAIKGPLGNVGMIFLGKQIINEVTAYTGMLLAARLGWPFLADVVKIECDRKKLICQCEVPEGGRNVVETTTPAVLAPGKGLNQPRFASIKAIIAARKKNIPRIDLSQLGVSDSEQRIEIRKMSPAPVVPRKQVEITGSADEQASSLARVILKELAALGNL